MAVITIPVNHTKTQTDAGLWDGGRPKREPSTALHARTPSRRGLDIPFTEAKAVGRAIVAWGWSTVHLVGYIRPRRALWEETRGSVTHQWSWDKLKRQPALLRPFQATIHEY